MADASSSLQAVLPDYEVQTELGRGAMGIVYLATHKALGRTVAVKELPASFAADEGVRARFLSEARVVASLDHPHVVVIHDFVDRNGHLALVMEHLPNGTVWDQFLHHGLAAPRACGLVLATLAGLHHAHDRGVMHRDIKPENLIFTHDWQLKVTDFGIAQVLTGDTTMGTDEGSIVGTPAYMSPEQAEGRTCGPPADVYASGAMLYEMLSGALPFPNAETAMDMAFARLREDPVPIDAVGTAVPDAIAEVTMQALARKEGERYPDAEAFGVALAEAAAFTWGPDWMGESGTAVQGSQAIERAARTTERRIVDMGAVGETVAAAPDALDADELPSEVSEAVESPDAPAADDAASAAAVAPSAPAPAPVFEAVPVAAVQPRQREHIGGADLNELAPDDIISIKEVRGPGSPLVPLLIALVLLALAAGAALLGQGEDPVAQNAGTVAVRGEALDGSDVVGVDLTEPFAISAPDGDVNATFLGVPIGSASIAGGSLDPGYLQYTGAGVIELAIDDDTTVPVRATNSPYPTAPFAIAALIGVGALASVQSNIRGLRARRIRIAPYLGAAISGAILGAAVAVVAMLVLQTPTSLTAVIASAALSAAGCAVLGEAYRRWYRRRRMKRLTAARGRAR